MSMDSFIPPVPNGETNAVGAISSPVLIEDEPFLRKHEPWLFDHLTEFEINIALDIWQTSDIPEELLDVTGPQEDTSMEARELLSEASRQMRAMCTAVSNSVPKSQSTDADDSIAGQTIGNNEDNSEGKGKAREAADSNTSRSHTLHVPSFSFFHSRTASVNTVGSSSVASGKSSWANQSAESITSVESLANDDDRGNKGKQSSMMNPFAGSVAQVKQKWLRTKVLGGLSNAVKVETKAPTTEDEATRTVSISPVSAGSKIGGRVFGRLMEKTKSTASRPVNPPTQPGPIEGASQTTHECASCMDDIPSEQSTVLSCTHCYCQECFGQMIVTASKNEVQWPPRCCLTDIPRATIVKNITPAQLKIFHEKEQEYSVKADDRWYCANARKCGKFFIPKVDGQDAVKCTHCKFLMCTACRGKAHKRNKHCDKDTNLQATLDHARQEGWRTCASCRSIIEYTVGCNHMTCTCGYEFCYACDKKWKTCTCTYADLQNYIRNHQDGAASSSNAGARRRIFLGDNRPAAELRNAQLGDIRRQRDEERRQADEQQLRETQEREMRERQEQEERELQERQDREERELRERQEQEELEEALRAIAEQEARELEARLQQEREEAQRIEEQRVAAINRFTSALLYTMDQLTEPALDLLQVKHRSLISQVETIVPDVEKIEQESRQKLDTKKRLQKLDLIELQDRHKAEMKNFQKRYEKMINIAADLRRSHPAEPADQGYVTEMHRRASSYASALADAQQSEVEYMAESQKRSVERATRIYQDQTCALLEQVDISWASHEESQKPFGDYCHEVIKQKLENSCVKAIADLKWYQTRQELVASLCRDRVAHLLSSGADAPPLTGLKEPAGVAE